MIVEAIRFSVAKLWRVSSIYLHFIFDQRGMSKNQFLDRGDGLELSKSLMIKETVGGRSEFEKIVKSPTCFSFSLYFLASLYLVMIWIVDVRTVAMSN